VLSAIWGNDQAPAPAAMNSDMYLTFEEYYIIGTIIVRNRENSNSPARRSQEKEGWY
jgi:hypothetical protein